MTQRIELAWLLLTLAGQEAATVDAGRHVLSAQRAAHLLLRSTQDDCSVFAGLPTTLSAGHRVLGVAGTEGDMSYLEISGPTRPDEWFGTTPPLRCFEEARVRGSLALLAEGLALPEPGEKDSIFDRGWIETIFLAQVDDVERDLALGLSWFYERRSPSMVPIEDRSLHSVGFWDRVATALIDEAFREGQLEGEVTIARVAQEPTGRRLLVHLALVLEHQREGPEESPVPRTNDLVSQVCVGSIPTSRLRLELEGSGSFLIERDSRHLIAWRFPCTAKLDWELELELNCLGYRVPPCPISQTFTGFLALEGFQERRPASRGE